MALSFPSVEWFEALAAIANEDAGFKKFGTLSASVAFKVGEQAYNVTFDVLNAGDIREVDDDAMRDADFIIELRPEQWRGMIEDIAANGAATRDWTLNTLDLIDDEPIHKNLVDDGFRADKFFRYNPSLQRFIDNAAQLDTEFN
jgi:hypothetical protein